MVGQLCYAWSFPPPPHPTPVLGRVGFRAWEGKKALIAEVSVTPKSFPETRCYTTVQTVGKSWGRCPRVSYLDGVSEPLSLTSVEGVFHSLVSNSPQ